MSDNVNTGTIDDGNSAPTVPVDSSPPSQAAPDIKLLNTNGGLDPSWNPFIEFSQILSITAPPADDPNVISCATSRFFDSTFSTQKIPDAFGQDGEILPTRKWEKYVVMGLATTSDQPRTLDYVLNAFSIEDDLPQPVKSIIDVLKSPAASQVLPTFQVDSTKKRNGLWIDVDSDGSLEIVTSLAVKMNLDSTIQFADDVLQSLKGFDLDITASDLGFDKLKPRLRLKNRTRIRQDGTNFRSESAFEVTIELPVKGFILSLKATAAGDLDFAIFNNPDVPGDIFQKITNILTNKPSQDQVMPQETGVLSGLNLWYITVDLSEDTIGFKIAFIVTLSVLGQDVSIALTYDSGTGTFTGSFLFQQRFLARLSPHFDDFGDLPQELDIATISQGFDLAKSSQFGNVPNGIPTVVTEAFISYQKAKGNSASTLWVSATLQSKSAIAPSTIPAPFEWKTVSLDLVKSRDLQLSVFSSFQLNPKTPKFSIGILQAAVSYDAGVWSLLGHAENIQISAVAEYFDPDLSASVMDVLGRLVIKNIDVSYTYEKRVASSFLFSGIIQLGALRLNVYYQYATKEAAAAGATAADNKAKSGDELVKPLTVPDNQDTFWQFDAYLDTAENASKVGEIIDSIVEGASDNLPPFVRDIEVKSDDPSAHLVTLAVKKIAKDKVVFVLQVAINAVKFILVQISTTTPASGGTPATATTKRLFRFSVDQLPLISNLPVVRELPQPFQELQYMWVPTGGLTRNDVSAINTQLRPVDSLFFKPATQAAADPNSPVDPVVLVQGHHFVIVENNAAVLDHVFAGASPAAAPVAKGDIDNGRSTSGEIQNGGVQNGGTQGGDSGKDKSMASSKTPQGEAEEPAHAPTKGTIKKDTSFLSISALSLEYKDGMLWIYVDATMALGPLQFALLGFGIGFSLADLKLDHMADLLKTLEFQLRGMYVNFDKPPILISGGFERETASVGNEIQKSYRGGVGVQIPPYGFAAVGEYAEVTKESGGTYKSVFVYAKLDGPLIDLEFVIIKGVRIGFGYNTVIRQPAVQELFQFPLISDSGLQGSGNNPIAILNSLRKGANPWITIKEDNYWLAFGLTVSSFDIINGTIVALVSFRCNGPIFSLFGNLTISHPPDAPNDYMRLIYIEILASAELNFAEDCFKLQGALSPASFVYNPFAHLHGSMALWTFFGRNDHAGDWVFTLGGYHRKFDVPSHYPPAASLDRLGVTFSIGIVRISGGVYFAITPKAVMAGAAIHCELDIGPVFAYLDAAFDAMVQFHPIHFWVSMHIEVGVECDIPLLICTIHIKIHIGAQLEIEGPEFGGTAYVDFWFFSFDIPFGETPHSPDPIDLATFYDLNFRAGPSDVSENRVQPEEDLVVQLKMSLEDGTFPMPVDDSVKAGESAATKPPDSTGAGTKWFVKGGSFKFRVSSVFAIGSAWVETEESAANGNLLREQDKKLLQQVTLDPTASSIYSLPMDVSIPIESDMYIGITSDGGEEMNVSTGWTSSFITKPMPQAFWNSPENPPNRLSSDKGTVNLQMSVAFVAPPPILAKAKVPQFNATDMAKSCAGTNVLPASEPVQAEFLPAEATDTPKTWDDMQKTWETSAKSSNVLANGMVSSCMAALGWNNPAADVLAKLAPTNLQPWIFDAAFPQRLVSGTGGADDSVKDGFSNFYLELPRVSAH